jgi:hypothetical protein
VLILLDCLFNSRIGHQIIVVQENTSNRIQVIVLQVLSHTFIDDIKSVSSVCSFVAVCLFVEIFQEMHVINFKSPHLVILHKNCLHTFLMRYASYIKTNLSKGTRKLVTIIVTVPLL